MNTHTILLTAVLMAAPFAPAEEYELIDARTGEPAAVFSIVNTAAPMERILARVHDRASADAAAPAMERLVVDGTCPPGLAAKLSNARVVKVTTLMTPALHVLIAHDCFGSEAMKKALAPLLEESDPMADGDAARLYSLVLELDAPMQGLAATLNGVQDKAAAEAAVEKVQATTRWLHDWVASAESVPERVEASDDQLSRIMYRSQVAPGAMLTAWGHLHLRSAEYYGVSALGEALAALNRELARVGCDIDAEQAGRGVAVADEIEAALHERIALAASVVDKASADAAAPALKASTQRLKAAVCRGVTVDVYKFRPLFELLNVNGMNIIVALEELEPPFYGSEALQQSCDRRIND